MTLLSDIKTNKLVISGQHYITVVSLMCICLCIIMYISIVILRTSYDDTFNI